MSVAKVGDIAEQVRGVSYSKADAVAQKDAGLVPILRANNITENGLVFTDLVYVPEKYVRPNQYIMQGDVVIAASSGSIDVVGKAGEARTDFRGSFGAFCKVLRPNQQKVNPVYFANFFKTTAYRRRISSLAAGANINNLRNEHLDDLEISLPPLGEQKRIAAILDKADALRAKRRQAIALLDSLTQSIFLEMFGDPVSNPRGFQFVPLADLVDPRDRLNYGVVQPGDDVEGGVPLIRVSDLQRGMVDRSNLRLIDPRVSAKHSKSVLKGTEILISCVGSIGEIALASKADKGSNVARAVARVPLKAQLSREFVATYLRTDRVQQYFTKELRTVSQPTLNIKQILETPVPLVVPADADKFESRLRSVRRTIYNAELSNTYVSDLFASLQQRAFCGQL